MANRHFGEIGDLWKHLPLAEIIAIEQPKNIWETHAGSAQYELTHSYERDYGVYYFYEHIPTSTSLSSSNYAQILNNLEQQNQLYVYPGSPFIAMQLLCNTRSHFVFCDLDENSITNIREIAANLGISISRIEIVQEDGLDYINKLGSELPHDNLSQTLVHIDPYHPLEKSILGLNSFDLFCRLSKRGIKCVLWYGYESISWQKTIFDALNLARQESEITASQIEFWCGDIQLHLTRDPSFAINTGLVSCGIITSNLSAKTIAICDRLGKGLEKLYATAQLADGRSGAMEYKSFIL